MRLRAAILLILAAAALKASGQWPGSPASFAAWWGGSQLSIPADGLVFWHRPGTTLSTNAYFGASYPATLTGTMSITAEGYFGTNDDASAVWYPSIPSKETATGFTVAFWAKGQIDLIQYFFANHGHAFSGNGFNAYVDAYEAVWFRYGDGAKIQRGRKTGNGAWTTNWTHLAFVFDPAAGSTSVTNHLNYSIWKNGTRVDTSDYSIGTDPVWAAATNDFYVHAAQGNANEFRGSIDEVAVWWRALSSNEISRVMTATKGSKL